MCAEFGSHTLEKELPMSREYEYVSRSCSGTLSYDSVEDRQTRLAEFLNELTQEGLEPVSWSLDQERNERSDGYAYWFQWVVLCRRQR